ncbi:MAG: hypothetical protein ACPG7F_08865, partial [Aggregatilineales bacterium]
MMIIRRILLKLYAALYGLLRPIIFMQSAQAAHEHVIDLLSRADTSDVACLIADIVRFMLASRRKIMIGGVAFESPFILAA